jgi:hypothetical protein
VRNFRPTIRAVILAALLAASQASAHEIPSDVRIQIIVKPAGDRLELIVRVPLEAMRDIEFPTVGPGYLDLDNAEQHLRDAAMTWLADGLALYEEGQPLGPPRLLNSRASIPSDRSFSGYDTAIAHIRSAPLPPSTELIWQQALLDTLFELPIQSEASRFSIRPDLARLGLSVVTVIRFVAPDGRERIYEFRGEAEILPLDPRWHQAALRFVASGFDHILDGLDHLLFLLCLVLPFRRNVRSLVLIVTAFTLAHSITLIGSAYGLAPSALWFPPLVEALIAASIFYMAVENVVAPNIRTRWGLAFGFGLVHGFGFSFALSETLQFAGDHVLLSLLAFNLGVELGQLLVLALLIPLLAVVFRYGIRERIGTLIICVLVAHTAWHWMLERISDLNSFMDV